MERLGVVERNFQDLVENYSNHNHKGSSNHPFFNAQHAPFVKIKNSLFKKYRELDSVRDCVKLEENSQADCLSMDGKRYIPLTVTFDSFTIGPMTCDITPRNPYKDSFISRCHANIRGRPWEATFQENTDGKRASFVIPIQDQDAGERDKAAADRSPVGIMKEAAKRYSPLNAILDSFAIEHVDGKRYIPPNKILDYFYITPRNLDIDRGGSWQDILREENERELYIPLTVTLDSFTGPPVTYDIIPKNPDRDFISRFRENFRGRAWEATFPENTDPINADVEISCSERVIGLSDPLSDPRYRPIYKGNCGIGIWNLKVGRIEELLEPATLEDLSLPDACDASFNPASLQNLSKEEAAKILAEKGYTDEGKDKELKELFSDRPGSDNGNYSGSHAEPTRIVELLSLFSGIVFAGATGYSAYKTYETASKYLSPGWSRKTDRHSLEKRQQLGWDALKWGTGMTVSAALTLYTFLRR